MPSPVISVVIPWKIFEGSRGFTRIVSSDCPSMSMNPGATTFPWASIVRFAAALPRSPIAAIRPSRIPTSPEYHGEPVPSTMCPWVITTSNAGAFAGSCAPAASTAKPPKTPQNSPRVFKCIPPLPFCNHHRFVALRRFSAAVLLSHLTIGQPPAAPAFGVLCPAVLK